MKLLFIHQNFPGQYRHVAARFAADPAHRVVAIGDHANVIRRDRLHGVHLVAYPTPPGATQHVHPYLRGQEAAVRRGQAVARALQGLRKQGFVPDLICAHPGWGEALFLKDAMPESALLAYFEFYYRARGADVGFDPEYPSSLDDACRVRVKNATLLVSLDAADAGVAPTAWQQAQSPPGFRHKISVAHDGIDTGIVCPDGDDTFTLPNGAVLGARDEVVTYVARNLEPYRGFHIFMRALPRILARRPQAQVLIVGGDEVSYGVPARGGGTYRAALLAELGESLDTSRVHFMGRLPYRRYLSVLRVASVHVYLTYPFVLSWSMLEAMAAGCLVIGSRTRPVEEVIEDGVNGWLTDFFDVAALSERVCDALDAGEALAQVRAAARQTVVDRYDLARVCLPRQIGLIESLARQGGALAVPADELSR